MIKNKIICIFLTIFVIQFMISCKKSCDVDGIYVSELLLIYSAQRDYNYCDLLTSATTNDKVAVRKLSLLEINDSAGYDHGQVLVDLIIKLGENEYIKSIGTIDSLQRKEYYHTFKQD